MKISQSQIRFTKFSACFPPYSQVFANLPQDPMNAQDLLRNCAVEAHKLGRWHDAEKFLRESLRQQRRLYAYAAFGKTDFYKRIFPLEKRPRKLCQLIGAQTSNAFWGDGYSFWKLLRSMLVFVFVVGPALIAYFSILSGEKDFLDHLVQWPLYIQATLDFIFGTSLAGDVSLAVKFESALVLLLRLVSIIFFGLFVTVVNRIISAGPVW